MLILLARPDPVPDWLCLFKSSDEGPGTRWITVHPNGKDEEGHAVLIRESATSPGTWHVIGGADGKLNHLTLDHIGSKADWTQRAKDKRAKEKAEGKQATPETQKAAKEAKKQNKIRFVNRVADALGWDKNWYKTAEDYIRENPELSTDPMAAGLLANDNLNAHVKKAREEYGRYKRRLQADAEARHEAGLGDLSLDNDPYRATAAELDAGQIRDKILHHRDQQVEAAAEEQTTRADEGKLYDGLATTLYTMPSDASSTEIGEVVGRVGQPNTDEARAILAQLRTQDLSPSEAAGKLQELAATVRDGHTDLTGGSQAKHHQEVKDLYEQAQAAYHGGDEDTAARYIEHAKRLTGDYNVGALDLVGQQAQEGKGYKPVERQRARENIAAQGADTPEAIAQKLQDIARHRDDLGRDSSGAGDVLDYAAKKQQKALERAHQAATTGDTKAAQDYILEAQKEEIYESDLADKLADTSDDRPGPNIAKAEAAIDARNRMVAAHAARRQVKSTGGGGGSGGGGQSGGGGSGGGRVGGAKVEDETLDMSKAHDLMKAWGEYRDRDKQLDIARREASIDPDAFKTALKDERVDDTALSDEHVAKITGAIKQLADAKVHSALIDRIENPGVFQAAAGEDQVRAGSIAKWVDLGRDAAFNLIGQLCGDGMEIDRAKFSALGLKEGTALLAQHIANGVTEQRRQEIVAGLEHYHSGRALNVASQAMRAADACLEQAKEFELGGRVDGADLSEIAHYNKLRMECVDQALATVGTAYGELNATAEMIWALGGARQSQDLGHTIPGGERDRLGLVVLGQSLGLDPGEFRVNSPTYDPETKKASPGSVYVSPDGTGKLFRKNGMGAQKRETTLNNIKADPGEDNYLPQGFARRPSSSFDDPEKRPDQYSSTPQWKGVDFSSTEGEERLKDHIGERLADGISPHQLYNEMRGEQFTNANTHGDDQRTKYSDALDRVFPSPDDEGWHEQMERWAQKMVGAGNTLDSQALDPDNPRTIEAAHRAIARNPYGKYAFHKVGELDAGDQAKLRDYAYKKLWNLGGDRPHEEDAEQAQPPETDTWGNIKGDTLPKGVPEDPQGERWKAYVKQMGGTVPAYNALLHHIRGDMMGQFSETYGQVTGTALRTGQAPIPGGGRFYQHHASDQDRQRIEDAAATTEGGKEGQERARGTLARQIAEDKPQAGMPDRATIGKYAEGRLASVWKNVGESFDPNRPVDLLKTRDLSMGGRYVNQQRAIKAIGGVKRLFLALGVGSGKTAISLGGYTNAHAAGEASHALYSVPQNMVGQYGSEASTFLDPARKYKWFSKPGASQEERHEKLASKDHHFVVTTHESLRGDVVKAVAEHRGISPKQAEAFLRGDTAADGTPRYRDAKEGTTERGKQAIGGYKPDVDAEREERAAAVKEAFEHKGWGHRFQYFCVDEGHKALNRQGKEDSLLAHCLDGISDNAKHYVPMSVAGDSRLFLRQGDKYEIVSIAELADRMGVGDGEVLDFGAAGLDLRVRSYDPATNALVWAEVYGVHKYRCDKRTFKIKAQYGHEITVTERHSLQVVRAGQLLRLGGEEVVPGDYLVTEGRIPQETATDTIDILSYLDHAKYAAYGDFADEINAHHKGFERYNYLNQSQYGPYLPLPKIAEYGVDHARVGRVMTRLGKGRYWAKPSVPAEALAYLVGLVAGDGWVGTDYRLSLAVADVDVPAVEAYLETLREWFSLDWDKRQYTGCVNLRINCRPLGELFHSWFGGQKAPTKRLPGEVFGWSLAAKREVVRGLVDSDGHERCVSGLDKNVFVTSTSKGLLFDLYTLLKYFGEVSKLHARKPTPDEREAYRNSRPSYSLIFKPLDHDSGKERNSLHAMRRSGLAIAGAELLLVRAVEEVQEEFVYDISVRGTEQFFVNGVLSWNTGTPVKNDLSEAYDSLTKIDRHRFPESKRADWMRDNAGVGKIPARIRAARGDAAGTPNDPKDWTNVALAEVYQRALAPYMLQTRVPLSQPLTRRKEEIELTGAHKEAFEDVTRANANARKARAQGGYDLDALKTLSPKSFEGVPESEHPQVAARLHQGLAMTLRGAYNRALHARPEGNDKLDRLSKVVGDYRKANSFHSGKDGKPHKGKSVIVFAHNLDSVAAIKARLEQDGHRVGVITGEHSAAEKDKAKLGFQPANYKSNLQRGEPDKDAQHDVLICSDAVSAGADLPRAEAVVNFDTPDTAATHEQRTARAHRLSSEHPVEQVNLVSHTPYEQKNWLRLADKYALSDVSQNPSEKADDTGLQHSLVEGAKQVAARREQGRRQQQQEPEKQQKS